MTIGSQLGRVLLACAIATGAHISHATQVIIGQAGPMSGLEANQGRAYAAGMQLYFNFVNKTGGVNGHTFNLVRKDDGGRADDTVKLTRQMLADERPLVLAGYFGSRNVGDLLATGLLEKEKIALIGSRSTEIRAEVPLLYKPEVQGFSESTEQVVGERRMRR
jgi:branched-chain amino acid transport system substrate-binding protein